MLSPGDCANFLGPSRPLYRLQHLSTPDESMHRGPMAAIQSANRSVAERSQSDKPGAAMDMWTANNSLPTCPQPYDYGDQTVPPGPAETLWTANSGLPTSSPPTAIVTKPTAAPAS
jgi:hypothetical protein